MAGSSGRRAVGRAALQLGRRAAAVPGQLPGPPLVWGVAAGGALLGAGVLGGAALERLLVGRARLRPDPVTGEPLGRLPGRGRLVETEDGVVLQVEEAGDPGADVTVVLLHGYTMDMTSWHFQRRDLGARARLVLYDHRGHGRSGYGDPARATIGQLARDLHRVLEATCPRGPVVLVGHSMGGMTIMALAASHPELFGDRVRAVGLVTTSAGRLAEHTFGLPRQVADAARKALPLALPATRRTGPLLEHGRVLAGDAVFLLTRRYAFGSRKVSPSLVDFVERMSAGTPLAVAADFYRTFVDHDTSAALDVVARVPTTVVGAEKDLITPVDHSRAIAASTPGARLVVLEGAGHMAMLEQHEAVTAEVARLVDAARRG